LHIKGTSIRTLSSRTGKTLGATYRQLTTELAELPDNNLVTLKYCNPNRYCGVLLVDGKYVKVKGYDRKIPFIYGIDYETHDIPVCVLMPSENYLALRQFFMKLRNANYRLRGIVCDDNENIRAALDHVFQDKPVQLCHTHFLENIRKALHTRTEEKYRPFITDLKQALFCKQLKKKKHIRRDMILLTQKYQNDSAALSTLKHIEEYFDLLTNHLAIGGCPKTNNLIESYNKQLNGRLKTIQGFETLETAKRWLFAWILRRRLTPFTDCRKPFKHLNGKCSLERVWKGKFIHPDWF